MYVWEAINWKTVFTKEQRLIGLESSVLVIYQMMLNYYIIILEKKNP